jgi:hypothetical protein
MIRLSAMAELLTGLATAPASADSVSPDISPELDDIVLAHEFTHALEDQYWPLDDPKDPDRSASTDQGTAHDILAEGSATREMIEVTPAQWGCGLPDYYFRLWNLIHSGMGEWVLNYELGGGLVARRQSEALRETTRTTRLPRGVLASRCSARVPQSPDKTIARSSVLCGVGASFTAHEMGGRSVHVLPLRLLLNRTTGSGNSSLHVLGTGLSHREATKYSGASARFRLLGIPMWTTHESPPTRG